MIAVPARRSLPTITDVAARAGVSTATVSKVINARSGVAAPTAQRVLSTIEAMGYEPSLAATRLRGGTARVVGVLFSELGQWAGEVLKGVAAAATASCEMEPIERISASPPVRTTSRLPRRKRASSPGSASPRLLTRK